MVSTSEVIRCSWCDYSRFYPLENSNLVCSCANCGELKGLEDTSDQYIDVEELE